ncbi:MAG: hypothetical protein HRT69_13845 [Flavobacteriaceae bacterium]|nr:hypothetical protein [Flavobacteriaceae bacterium]
MNLLKEIKEVIVLIDSVEDWRNSFSDERYIKASKLNDILYGVPLNQVTNCGCVDDILTLLPTWLNNKEKLNLKIQQMESKFKLKESAGNIWLPSKHLHISTHNITDELALMLLESFPVHIKSFETYPNDWKDLIEKSYSDDELAELRIEADKLAKEKEIKKAHKNLGGKKLEAYIAKNV